MPAAPNLPALSQSQLTPSGARQQLGKLLPITLGVLKGQFATYRNRAGRLKILR